MSPSPADDRELIARLRAGDSETPHARRLIDVVLDRPSGDPDDDLAVLARQLQRALERIDRAATTIERVIGERDDARADARAWTDGALREVGDLRNALTAANARIATLEADAAARVEQEREACAKLIEDGFPRVVGEPFRNDGLPSKNDKCPHGRWQYEDCEACCVDAIRSRSTRGTPT